MSASACVVLAMLSIRFISIRISFIESHQPDVLIIILKFNIYQAFWSMCFVMCVWGPNNDALWNCAENRIASLCLFNLVSACIHFGTAMIGRDIFGSFFSNIKILKKEIIIKAESWSQFDALWLWPGIRVFLQSQPVGKRSV